MSGRYACPHCKEEADSSWLESWGLDGLQQLSSGVKEQEDLKLPSQLASCKRAAESTPVAKITKLRGSNAGPLAEIGSVKSPAPVTGPPQGSSPLLGKSGTHVPLFVASPTDPIIVPFPCFANRRSRKPHTEAIAEAIAYFARHSTCLVLFEDENLNSRCLEVLEII